MASSRSVVILLAVAVMVSAGPVPLPREPSGKEPSTEIPRRTNGTAPDSYPNANNTLDIVLDIGLPVEMNFTGPIIYGNNSGVAFSGSTTGCSVSTCALAKLGESLQGGGDEIAGAATSDKFGPGK